MRNAARQIKWLDGGHDVAPPEAFGLWAEAIHRLYLERREAREAAREAAAEVEEYERSVQALPDGIAILDADLHIRWSNAAAQRLLGLRDPEDRGQHIDNLLRHPEFMDYRRRGELDRFVQIPAPTAPDSVIMVGLVPFSAEQFPAGVPGRDRAGADRPGAPGLPEQRPRTSFEPPSRCSEAISRCCRTRRPRTSSPLAGSGRWKR